MDFASHVASYALGDDWMDLFDLVIFFARKPSFFSDRSDSLQQWQYTVLYVKLEGSALGKAVLDLTLNLCFPRRPFFRLHEDLETESFSCWNKLETGKIFSQVLGR